MITERLSGLTIARGLSYQTMLAQSAIIVFTLVFGTLLMVGASAAVRPLYPAVAVVVAAFLFSVHRGQYVSFVIWLFMVTPFVRRVTDYQLGWTETSLVVLAPLLAAGISVLMLLKKLPLLYSVSFLPFLIFLVGLLYGVFVGMVNQGVMPASYDLLLWAVPLAFGFAIAADWRSFPMYQDAIFRTFLLGGIVLGAYGIYQWFFLPPWDAYFMLNSTISSIGLPFPQQMRVFSTMNSPAAYGAFSLPTLLIVLVASSWMRYPAAALTFGAVALSIVRTAWLGWAIGVVMLLAGLRTPGRLKLVAGLGLLVLLALPLISSEEIGQRFFDRLATFTDLEEDKSWQARSALYDRLTEDALTNVWGTGTGAVGIATKLASKSNTVAFQIDSGLLFVPYTLGWPGAICLTIAVAMLMLRPPGIITRENETAVQVGTAVCTALIAMMLSYNSMYGPGGMVFWTFMGLRLCGRVWAANRQPG